MAGNSESKWESIFGGELKGITADQVWLLLADFCNIHKWFPYLAECHKAEGEEGKPGLIRYGASIPQFPGDDGKPFCWAREKLVMINPIQRSVTYQILENNMGIKSYVGTFQVLTVGGGDGEDGCRLQWSIVADPLEGKTYEEYESLRNSIFQLVLQNIQTLISVSS